MSSTRQQLVIVGRDPTPRLRLDENKPEERRSLILAALEASSATTIEHADPAEGSAALELAVTLGIVSASRLDFLRTAHGLWRAAPSPEPSFASPETADQDGLVPNFFVRQPAAATELWARRLAWHATDVYTPIYADLGTTLADDAAVCKRATERLLCTDGQAGVAAVYALTTQPGHHASLEHYGGYCFLNHAALAFRLLERGGRRPYLIDLDYHAGDGTASLLGAAGMTSLHAPHDYPYVSPSAPWALSVPPGTGWAQYEPLLREALRRRPAECDALVVSLGYDTLDGDPCAAEGHRLALQPADFGPMRRLLDEAGLPLLVLQEGGYHMENIAAAAAAFWAG